MCAASDSSPNTPIPGQNGPIDIIKHRWIYLGFSALLLVPGIFFIIMNMTQLPYHAPVRLGIDFIGGTILEYGFERKLTMQDMPAITEVFEKRGYPGAIVQLEQEGAAMTSEGKTEAADQSVDTATKTADPSEPATTDKVPEKAGTTQTADEKAKTQPLESPAPTPPEAEKTGAQPGQASQPQPETGGASPANPGTDNANAEKTVTAPPENTAAPAAGNPNVPVQQGVASSTDTQEKTGTAPAAQPAEEKAAGETTTAVEAQTPAVNASVPKAEHIKSVVSIRSKKLSDADATAITQDLSQRFGAITLLQRNSIGPSLASELLRNGLLALGLAYVLIIGYLTFRFQFDYALCAIIGLVHDTIFVFGIYAMFGYLFGTEIDSLFITAILTVVGFSVHDTIVVFDRLRENTRIYYSKKLPFSQIANISVNQTLARSINTSLTALLTLSALYFFGGETTKEFVLTMILGIIVGTYSSIFVASALLTLWRGDSTGTTTSSSGGKREPAMAGSR